MQDVEKVEIHENPLQPNAAGNLEIVSGNDVAQELARCRKCRILCGGESIVVALTVLGLGGGNIYSFFLKTGFQLRFTREGAWVFFALATLSCLLALSFIVRTCIAIQPRKEKGAKESKTTSKIAAAVNVVVVWYNRLFDVNGKYYLIKMYATEAFEHIQQVYSLTTDNQV